MWEEHEGPGWAWRVTEGSVVVGRGKGLRATQVVGGSDMIWCGLSQGPPTTKELDHRVKREGESCRGCLSLIGPGGLVAGTGWE